MGSWKLVTLREKRLCRRGVRVKRSEEHTSELQSLRHLVCRLLLEKKIVQICSAFTSFIGSPPLHWLHSSSDLPEPVSSTPCAQGAELATHQCAPFAWFFFNDTATTEIYTLSLHDALPI